ncbi:MAG: hypothetical protein KatS3mg131_2941 [Candidatus Tectimicrobiota bacterium]|nr:MAG: hypothetical protein KatS3mg131_2941 [Candidatus Tectomicrobia bacterium]
MPHVTETIVYAGDGSVCERTVAVAPAPASSVEITTDAQGIPKPTVKVWHEDPAQALEIALRLYQAACAALGCHREA